MSQIFPHANHVAAVLILVIGFGFHWLGQAIAVIDQELAMGVGLVWEKEPPPAARAYGNAVAKTDLLVGWTYPLAGLGLMLGAPWGYKLAWAPGVLFVYHGLSAWFADANLAKLGYRRRNRVLWAGWCLANLAAGGLALLVAWAAP